MVKIICKWLILLILLSYIAIASIWAIDKASQRTIADIAIAIENNSEYNFVTEDGVKEKLQRIDAQILSTPVAELDLDNIENALSIDNSYEKVECYISSDDRLHIDIVPMIPEVRVITNDGNSYYINKDGKRIDAGNGFYVDVPVICGQFDENFNAKSLLPVTRHISADETMSRLITMVEAKSATDILLYPRVKGQIINIGDTTDLATKFDNLMLFYHNVLKYKGWEMYDTISVKFKDQVVASRRNKALKVHSTVVEDSTDREEMSLQGIEDLTAETTTTNSSQPQQQPTH
ncbi:MAG: hypothetical protein II308_04655 [Muribaculaceae bacterium]|nr:hypothetical protein [Muribaculaceae bacterium]